jgi:hypothetical protein
MISLAALRAASHGLRRADDEFPEFATAGYGSTDFLPVGGRPQAKRGTADLVQNPPPAPQNKWKALLRKRRQSL